MTRIIFFKIPENYSRKEARELSRTYLQKLYGHQKLTKDPAGKPKIGNEYISISYTRSLGCLAISNKNIGIDIEYIDPKFPWRDLTWILKKSELKTITKAEYERQIILFFRIWTIKEAYLKFIGKGFLVSPEEIEINTKNLSIKGHKGVSVFSQLLKLQNDLFAFAVVTEGGMGDGKITPSF